MACSTRERVFALICVKFPLMTFDTVIIETPELAATSRIVTSVRFDRRRDMGSRCFLLEDAEA